MTTADTTAYNAHNLAAYRDVAQPQPPAGSQLPD